MNDYHTKPLENLPGSYGCAVTITDATSIPDVINKVLLMDARKTLSEAFPDDEDAVIEIRGKVCSFHCDNQGIRYYSDPCPDEHKGLQCCGVAWLYFDGSDPLNSIPDEPLFDFDGELKPVNAGIYYELARIRIELSRD